MTTQPDNGPAVRPIPEDEPLPGLELTPDMVSKAMAGQLAALDAEIEDLTYKIEVIRLDVRLLKARREETQRFLNATKPRTVNRKPK